MISFNWFAHLSCQFENFPNNSHPEYPRNWRKIFRFRSRLKNASKESNFRCLKTISYAWWRCPLFYPLILDRAILFNPQRPLIQKNCRAKTFPRQLLLTWSLLWCYNKSVPLGFVPQGYWPIGQVGSAKHFLWRAIRTSNYGYLSTPTPTLEQKLDDKKFYRIRSQRIRSWRHFGDHG